ncbi:hypothetical protein MCHLDSM_05939 [Mycolicibacterium chlorophenolicum]|uniref:Uncharacterized protein n=1 Tax=Mycolicibacterium chlorophenolicum TaxID=37916 RepID=A0A0J6VJR8_9MYCO|nr:hypothetical protein MCHLDSM_05939 [Mycolicibacterium chlorophenolicum]
MSETRTQRELEIAADLLIDESDADTGAPF